MGGEGDGVRFGFKRRVLAENGTIRGKATAKTIKQPPRNPEGRKEGSRGSIQPRSIAAEKKKRKN